MDQPMRTAVEQKTPRERGVQMHAGSACADVAGEAAAFDCSRRWLCFPLLRRDVKNVVAANERVSVLGLEISKHEQNHGFVIATGQPVRSCRALDHCISRPSVGAAAAALFLTLSWPSTYSSVCSSATFM